MEIQIKARLKMLMAFVFSALFLTFSIALTGLGVYYLIIAFKADDLITGFIRSLNVLFIALATFELGIGISKEYATTRDRGDIFYVVRRTVTRFVSVASIALVLEGLMMVIKYSQLDLAGNLEYPVAIIVAGAVLLISLGGFLALTRPDGRHSRIRDHRPQRFPPEREAGQPALIRRVAESAGAASSVDGTDWI